MKKRRGWLRWTAVVVLLLVSLVLIFNQQIKYYIVGSYRPQLTSQTIKKNSQKKASYDFSNVKDLDLQSAARARASRQQVNIIGVVAIPSINMSVPIAKGVDNTTLALAAGTMREDMKMGQGNYALAGHNMANGSKILFSPLYYHAKVGQKVYLTDLNRVYEYKIYQRKFIPATDVQVVDDTPQKIITMVTCDATGANRLLIRGNFIKSEKFKQAQKSVQKALSEKYTNGR
ncbi:MAG TPA: class A sortase [Candidatus Limosilactobacillus merdipullorum]|uniref:Class A sortase n=1 Tax=Candidatus Limosilactobacillus merdipullorum TaxID=2838653 RepID=A0A9D1QNS1_9LACO|nr:class A sortase [Candidatus Limosilactobacillus merdipullorum]